MDDFLSPSEIWGLRVQSLYHDHQRLDEMARRFELKERPMLQACLKRHLLRSQVNFERELGKLTQEKDANRSWGGLEYLRRTFCASSFRTQLQLMSGIALSAGIGDSFGGGNNRWPHFDGDTCAIAERWLNRQREQLGLQTILGVIPGRGVLLEPDLGLVRLPFLDWDLWHLPLLGKALGLLAAVEDPFQCVKGAINTCLTSTGDPNAASLERRLLEHLFADLYAATVFGPAYAAAVIVFDLRYDDVGLYGLEDPNEDPLLEQNPPRVLPCASERAAALLYALRCVPGFTEEADRLEELAEGIFASVGAPAALPGAAQSLAGRLEKLAGGLGIPEAVLASAQADWKTALTLAERLASEEEPFPALPADRELAINTLVGALWKHRREHPAIAEAVLVEGEKLLAGGNDITTFWSDPLPPAEMAARANVQRSATRAYRLRAMLDDDRVRETHRVLAMRFYRLLSKELHERAQAEAQLKRGEFAKFWQTNVHLEDLYRIHHREAQEFMGGVLLRRAGLDCEPAALAWDDGKSGPPLCDLAEKLIGYLVERTGVDWTSRIIPGDNPFITNTTGVVRTRFPDWSLWNLPLMAHEFGHVAIGELPLIGAWLRGASLDLLEQMPDSKGLSKEGRKAQVQSFISQLEEVFADIFALYTIGPCFALAFIVREFSPAEAYLYRGDHPREAERLTALLRALKKMDDDQDAPAFAGVYTTLKSAIDQALQAASTQPDPDFVEREDRAFRWGEELYDEVDRYFRLGARYTAQRWKAAQIASDLLLEGTPFPFSKLDRIVATDFLDGFFLPDLLNALWWARRRPGLSAGDLQRLTASGFEVARHYFS